MKTTTAYIAGLGILALALPCRSLQTTDRVVISEVHYDPGGTPESIYEFVELYNAGTVVAYLDGAVITDEGNSGSNEATFQFPGTPIAGTSIALAPGARLLLVADATGSPYPGIDFEFYAGNGDSDHPSVPNLVKTSGLAMNLQLANAGDGLTLSIGLSNGNVIPCAEVVDGVSWESGGAGDVTSMGSGVCADPAPHPGVENSLLSLQRCQDGNDTDSSATDFGVAPRTPRAPNNCRLEPPVASSLSVTPCLPQAMAPIAVSVLAGDPDGDLAFVRAFYKRAASASFDSLDLAPVQDALYAANLPGQPDGSLVEIYVAVADSASHAVFLPTSAPAERAQIRVGVQAIAGVQASALSDSCASSSFAGQPVHVAGVVSHAAHEFSDEYFHVQNGVTPFSGIQVRVPNGWSMPALGDSILVSGIVAEIECQTAIVLDSTCSAILESNRPVRARIVSSIGDIDREENESLLLAIDGPIDVLSGFDSTASGLEFQVSDGGGAGWVGGDTFDPDGSGYWYVSPASGHTLEFLAGIVGARRPNAADPMTRLRIEPRRSEDIDVLLTTDAGPMEPAVVTGFALGPNRPNPFRPRTWIEFAVPGAGLAAVTVHDARGRLVRLLLQRHYPAAARERVVWDGTDAHGRSVPSGVYFAQLRTGDRVATRKMLLLR